VKLKEPDKIDPPYGGFLDFLERLAGGARLFHCRYCRIQFYDRRRLTTDPEPISPAPPDESAGSVKTSAGD
jgi:hypothetical protein